MKKNYLTVVPNAPSFLHSDIVYKFQFGSCNVTCYGKSKCHLGISAPTEKRVKYDDRSVIKDNILFCNLSPHLESFSFLTSNNNDFKVALMESLLINKYHPPLNENEQSLPLELFDS